MSLRQHAETELTALGYDLTDREEGPNKWMAESVLELVDVFAAQGHSGFSAPECIRLFNKVANYEPLCPLTGEDSEWTEYADGLFQNKRCSHVFKDGKDGEAYDSEGRIFREPSGSCYTSRDSRVPVTFPYTPTHEYVDVVAQDD